MNLDKTEPVLARTAIVGLIGAVLHLAVLLNWIPLDAGAEAETVGIIDMASLIVAAVLARRAVFPAAKVAAYVDAAAYEEKLDDGSLTPTIVTISPGVVAGPASVIPDGTPVTVDTPPGPAVNRATDTL